MMKMLLLGPLTLLSGSFCQGQSSETGVQTVCDVVKHPGLWDARTVSIASNVEASLHSTVLTGPECGEGIYMAHRSGKNEGKWPEFDDALIRKATGLDKRRLRVSVRGVYHSHVSHGSEKIRQLEVVDVMDVGFLPD